MKNIDTKIFVTQGFVVDGVGRLIISDAKMLLHINAASGIERGPENDADVVCPHVNIKCNNPGCVHVDFSCPIQPGFLCG